MEKQLTEVGSWIWCSRAHGAGTHTVTVHVIVAENYMASLDCSESVTLLADPPHDYLVYCLPLAAHILDHSTPRFHSDVSAHLPSLTQAVYHHEFCQG
jgi:hypothetical protein